MGLLSHRAERSEITEGDHIYTWRAAFTYSHHGIYIGESKVVHFTCRQEQNSRLSFSFFSSNSVLPTSLLPCLNFERCGFHQPESGVVLSCLDCFLNNGSLYRFQYEVARTIFLSKIRGGTCTTAKSDSPETVIYRALYLLQHGFGKYDILRNNCEDFAMYCKTGLLGWDRSGLGRSGQASAAFAIPLAGLVCSSLNLLIPSPIGVVTAMAGMYHISRYATDIGVRSDLVKVPVEIAAAVQHVAGREEKSSEGKESSSVGNKESSEEKETCSREEFEKANRW